MADRILREIIFPLRLETLHPIKRVAAYARVSTVKEDQENSLEAQKSYFQTLIQFNPAWENAGLYVDDGISGYIYPAEDVEQLVMAIEKFLKLSAEERIQMGLAGRKKVEKLFDRKIVVKKYLDEVYNRKESNQ